MKNYGLPKLETQHLHFDFTSTGEEIKYRPFLVKEQKRLLLLHKNQKMK